MKTALITGITGQDGAYLAKFLLKKEYCVIGITRSYNSTDLSKLNYLGIIDDVLIEGCDLLDMSNIIQIIKKHNPDEIYNLAAQSSVGLSFEQPIGTINYNVLSVVNLLEGIKNTNRMIKFYQASSSDMFGEVEKLPIKETTPFNPLSPYAVSKASAHWIAVNYRKSYQMFVCCGILFNHESYLRSENFIIKKLIHEAVDVYCGNKKTIKVGNLKIRRDFGYSPKYVEAMYLMMNAEKPDDYIICSGSSIELTDIAYYILKKLNLPLDLLVMEESLFRPTEIYEIYGDNTKAKIQLNWEYDLDFYQVLDIIINEELKARGLKELCI